MKRKQRALRVLVVPDKFKGSLTAAEAAAAIASGWQAARPQDQLELIPMSDGGDGFGETLSLQEDGRQRRVQTVNAAGEEIRAPWWWVAKSRTAIVETAQVIGLAQLPPGKFHPFHLDTTGLGMLLRKVLAQKPKSLLIGLGGSATNDGGFGMARVLGWKFRRQSGHELKRWTDLSELRRLEAPEKPLWQPETCVAVDVKNKLIGARGASRIYGPQKGLREEDMPQAERCLGQLGAVWQQTTGLKTAQREGAGAAGGLGFGCFAFLKGEPQSGFSVFAERSRLVSRLAEADLVITGEGSLDRSSLMGKGVGEVAKLCCDHMKLCLGLSGVLPNRRTTDPWFSWCAAMVGDLTDEQEALKHPERCLRQLAKNVAADWY